MTEPPEVTALTDPPGDVDPTDPFVILRGAVVSWEHRFHILVRIVIAFLVVVAIAGFVIALMFQSLQHRLDKADTAAETRREVLLNQSAALTTLSDSVSDIKGVVAAFAILANPESTPAQQAKAVHDLNAFVRRVEAAQRKADGQADGHIGGASARPPPTTQGTGGGGTTTTGGPATTTTTRPGATTTTTTEPPPSGVPIPVPSPLPMPMIPIPQPVCRVPFLCTA